MMGRLLPGFFMAGRDGVLVSGTRCCYVALLGSHEAEDHSCSRRGIRIAGSDGETGRVRCSGHVVLSREYGGQLDGSLARCLLVSQGHGSLEGLTGPA